MVTLKIEDVYKIQEKPKKPARFFVLLSDENGRQMKIFIGHFEAWAISIGLENKPMERPTTHDACLSLMQAAEASLQEVRLEMRHEEIFYATALVRVGETTREVDIRPSDAFALALRAKCPITVSRSNWDAWSTKK